MPGGTADCAIAPAMRIAHATSAIAALQTVCESGYYVT